MKKGLFFSALISVLASIFPFTACADELWYCPDGQTARQAFETGAIKEWPFYAEAAGARVQRQYPDTRLLAQAKYMERNGQSAAICQYYNNIGLVVTMIVPGLTPGDIEEGGYWRQEFIESSADQDVAGQEMLDVCTETENGLAVPSVKCGFLIPKG